MTWMRALTESGSHIGTILCSYWLPLYSGELGGSVNPWAWGTWETLFYCGEYSCILIGFLFRGYQICIVLVWPLFNLARDTQNFPPPGVTKSLSTITHLHSYTYLYHSSHPPPTLVTHSHPSQGACGSRVWANRRATGGAWLRPDQSTQPIWWRLLPSAAELWGGKWCHGKQCREVQRTCEKEVNQRNKMSCSHLLSVVVSVGVWKGGVMWVYSFS